MDSPAHDSLFFFVVLGFGGTFHVALVSLDHCVEQVAWLNLLRHLPLPPGARMQMLGEHGHPQPSS